MGERAPEFAEVMRMAAEAAVLQVHTCIPARVVKFDATKQKADCKPLVKIPYYVEGERKTISVSVVTDCPVVFPGAGGYRLTLPIQASPTSGTLGYLWFSERSLDKYLASAGSEVDPEVDHHHHLADGVFIPGGLPFGAPLSSCPTDEATLGKDDGPQIHCEDSTITIGDKSGSEFIALADKVLDELNAIASALSSHTHSGVQTGTGTSGTSSSSYTASSVAASQAKAK